MSRFLSLFLLACMAVAQQPDTFHIHATITDKNDKPVAIAPEQLKCEVGGHAAELIKIEKDLGMPRQYVVMVDTSNSGRRNAKSVANEVARVFAILGAAGHQGRLATFHSSAGMSQRPIPPEMISDSLKAIQYGGGTALMDTVAEGARKFAELSPGAVQRTLIIFSDFEDNQSKTTVEKAVSAAQTADVMVIAVYTGNSGNSMDDRGAPTANLLAEQTGGGAIFELSPDRRVQSIADLVASQVLITVRIPHSQAKLLKVKLKPLVKGIQIQHSPAMPATR